MSSYSLPARYQSYLGSGNFFQRQLSAVADALPGVIKKGLAATPNDSHPDNTGLPDMSDVDKSASNTKAGKTNTLIYAGVGVGAVLLLVLVMGKKKRAPAAA